MRAVIVPEPGGPDALVVADLPDPVAGPGEVVIDIAASAVNKADTLQRQGFYPPPPGASDVLGMECSGTISAVGDGVDAWSVGDEVCALLASGGYADKVAVPAGQVMPVPGGRRPGHRVRAARGRGDGLVQRVHDRRACGRARRSWCTAGRAGSARWRSSSHTPWGPPLSATAGSEDKLETCRSLGADIVVNYREDDFVAVLKEAGGADVILDNMGASYLMRNLDALKTEGRLVVIGMQGGTKAEIDLSVLHAQACRPRGHDAAGAPERREVRDLRCAWSSTCGRWWPTAR